MSYLLRRLRQLLLSFRTPRLALAVFGWLVVVAALLLSPARGPEVPLALLGLAGIIGAIALVDLRAGKQQALDRAVPDVVSDERLAGLEVRIEGVEAELGITDDRPPSAGFLGAADEGMPRVVVVVIADGPELAATLSSLTAAGKGVDWVALLVATPEELEPAWAASLGQRRLRVVPTSSRPSAREAVDIGRLHEPGRHTVVVRSGWRLRSSSLWYAANELQALRGIVDGIASGVVPDELYGSAGARVSLVGGNDLVAVADWAPASPRLRQILRPLAHAPVSALRAPSADLGFELLVPDIDAGMAVTEAGATAHLALDSDPASTASGLLSLAGRDAAELPPADRERAIGAIRASTRPVAPPAEPTVDVVAVASSRVVVERLHAWLAARGAVDRVLWLVHDGLDDSQGAQEAIDALGLPCRRAAAWVAERGSARAALVAYPYSRLTRAVADAAVDARCPVFEVRLAEDTVLRVEDVADLPPTVDVTDATLPELDGGTSFGLGVAARRWLRDGELLTNEEYPHLVPDTAAMRALRGAHSGETCVVIGNGPSLNELDLSKLAAVSTFGVNGIFYADDRLADKLTYYVVEDTMVMQDNLPEIRAYEARNKLFPTLYRDRVGSAPGTSYFTMNQGFYAGTSPAFCVPRFSVDATQRVYAGQSVTIMNLQLAYWMGFSTVALIGMDFSYTVPDDAEIEGNHITSAGDDPNHFHPEYFGKGKVWKDPKLDRVLANYQLAKMMFEADGRRIVNSTPGGKLELFDRVPYDDLFG